MNTLEMFFVQHVSKIDKISNFNFVLFLFNLFCTLNCKLFSQKWKNVIKNLEYSKKGKIVSTK